MALLLSNLTWWPLWKAKTIAWTDPGITKKKKKHYGNDVGIGSVLSVNAVVLLYLGFRGKKQTYTQLSVWTNIYGILESLVTRFRQFQALMLAEEVWCWPQSNLNPIHPNVVKRYCRFPHHPNQAFLDHDFCMVHPHAWTVWVAAYKGILDKCVWFIATNSSLVATVWGTSTYGSGIHILSAILLYVIVLVHLKH